MALIQQSEKTTWDNHLKNTENPHKTTARQVGSIKIYNSLKELNLTVTSPLVTVFETMETPSKLVCQIETTSSNTIYPASQGTLIITKNNTNSGTAVFTSLTGEASIGTFSEV